jgi:hypothetical protein
MSGRDLAEVRRIVILIALGIAVDVSAMLYVSNGSADIFAWTYQDCVHYRPEAPIGTHSRALYEVKSHAIPAPVCDRFEPRLRTWVYVWFLESVLTSAFIALAASLTIRPGLVSR